MFKTKLFATICAAASAVTVAVTALTLSVAGPAGVKTIHSLSANEAVATTIAGVFSSASDTATNISDFIEVIASEKTATNIGFKINHIKGLEEYSNFGGELELQLDTESQAAALLLEASLGSMDAVNGTIYIDKNEILASAPFLFDGVLRAGLDNLEEDLEDSLIGEYFLSASDIREIEEIYSLVMSEYANMAPQIEFDSETFTNGLTEVINASFEEAMNNMIVDELGKQDLNGGAYNGYDAKIAVSDLANILKDAIIYCLESPEFQDLVDQVIDYASEVSGEDLTAELGGVSGASLSQLTPMLETYWPTVVSEIETVLGKNIQFTIYISDTAELAGLVVEAYIADDCLSFNKADAANAEYSFKLAADFTGGKNIGDYSQVAVKLTENESGDYLAFDFTKQAESNGDFIIKFNFDDGENNSFEISANGNYVVDGTYFNLDVESLKFVQDDETLFDVGFNLGFKPIDTLSKPSGSPVYDVFEMSEMEFYSLFMEMQDTLEEFSEFFE